MHIVQSMQMLYMHAVHRWPAAFTKKYAAYKLNALNRLLYPTMQCIRLERPFLYSPYIYASLYWLIYESLFIPWDKNIER